MLRAFCLGLQNTGRLKLQGGRLFSGLKFTVVTRDRNQAKQIVAGRDNLRGDRCRLAEYENPGGHGTA